MIFINIKSREEFKYILCSNADILLASVDTGVMIWKDVDDFAKEFYLKKCQ